MRTTAVPTLALWAVSNELADRWERLSEHERESDAVLSLG
jgi:hypothetical protein